MTEGLTYGQIAVGINFNPPGDETDNLLKAKFADIIDICHEGRARSTGEAARLWSIAITEAQGAQMWAVKAASWK